MFTNKPTLVWYGLVALVLTNAITTLAQIKCATTQAHANVHQRSNSIDYKPLKGFRLENLNTDTMIIPVIVHVVHPNKPLGEGENITAEQVYSQFKALNDDFQRKGNGSNNNPVGAGMAIKFVPAIIDTLGQILSEPGINRVVTTVTTWNSIEQIKTDLQQNTIFNPNRYLNIWVVTLGGSLAGNLGYAQFPNQSGLPGLETLNNNPGIGRSDGIVVRYDAFGTTGNVRPSFSKGRTTTHEMGHFLGLHHIWGPSEDDPNCTEDDFCEDTPPTSGPINFCPNNPASCITTVTAMKENYMDYTSDACMNTFTVDQVARMLTTLQNSPRRSSLRSSLVHTTSSPVVTFTASAFSGCIGDTLQLFDSSRLSVNYTRKWLIFDPLRPLEVITSTSANPRIRFNSSGQYHVTLYIQAVSGFIQTITQANFISINPRLSLSTSFPGSGFECGKPIFLIPGGASVYNLSVNGIYFTSISGSGFFSYVPITTTSFVLEGITQNGCRAVRTLNLTLSSACDTLKMKDDEFDTSIYLSKTSHYAVPKIYPNPFSEHISIEGHQPINKIAFLDVLGQTVLEHHPKRENQDHILSVSTAALKKGLYIMRIYFDKTSLTYKMEKW